MRLDDSGSSVSALGVTRDLRIGNGTAGDAVKRQEKSRPSIESQNSSYASCCPTSKGVPDVTRSEISTPPRIISQPSSCRFEYQDSKSDNWVSRRDVRAAPSQEQLTTGWLINDHANLFCGFGDAKAHRVRRSVIFWMADEWLANPFFVRRRFKRQMADAVKQRIASDFTPEVTLLQQPTLRYTAKAPTTSEISLLLINSRMQLSAACRKCTGLRSSRLVEEAEEISAAHERQTDGFRIMALISVRCKLFHPPACSLATSRYQSGRARPRD